MNIPLYVEICYIAKKLKKIGMQVKKKSFYWSPTIQIRRIYYACCPPICWEWKSFSVFENHFTIIIISDKKLKPEVIFSKFAFDGFFEHLKEDCEQRGSINYSLWLARELFGSHRYILPRIVESPYLFPFQTEIVLCPTP